MVRLRCNVGAHRSTHISMHQICGCLDGSLQKLTLSSGLGHFFHLARWHLGPSLPPSLPNFSRQVSLPLILKRIHNRGNAKFWPQMELLETEAEMSQQTYLYLSSSIHFFLRKYMYLSSLICRCFYFLQSAQILFQERKQMVALTAAPFRGGKKPFLRLP